MDEIVQNAANGAISSTVPESSETRFNNLERNLELFQVITHLIYKIKYFIKILQENARHMGVIASDFSLKSQEPLNQKVHTLVSGLQVNLLASNFYMDSIITAKKALT